MALRAELPALPPLGASPLPRLSPLLRLCTHKATQTCRINFSAFPCGSRAFRAGRGPPVLPPPSPPPPPPLWPRQCHSPDTRGGGERSRTRRQMQIPLPPPRSTRTSGRRVRALPAATSLGARNRPGGRGCSPDKLSREPGEDAGCSRGRAGGRAGERGGRGGAEEEGRLPPSRKRRPPDLGASRPPPRAGFIQRRGPARPAAPSSAPGQAAQAPAVRALPLSPRRGASAPQAPAAAAAFRPAPRSLRVRNGAGSGAGLWTEPPPPPPPSSATPVAATALVASAAAAAACRVEPGARDGPGGRAGAKRQANRCARRSASAARAGGGRRREYEGREGGSGRGAASRAQREPGRA